jgi:hypothetical protein
MSPRFVSGHLAVICHDFLVPVRQLFKLNSLSVTQRCLALTNPPHFPMLKVLMKKKKMLIPLFYECDYFGNKQFGAKILCVRMPLWLPTRVTVT